MARWNMNLSWVGAYPTKIKTQKRWIFLPITKILLWGGGSIAAQYINFEIKFAHYESS